MTAKIRQGLGLLAVAAVALILSAPAWGTESVAMGAWGAATSITALVCGVAGFALLAIGLLRQRD